jgi:hypothetical protein
VPVLASCRAIAVAAGPILITPIAIAQTPQSM